jgi:hypothetical protein
MLDYYDRMPASTYEGVLQQDRQCTYERHMRRVRESTLAGKKNI